MSMKLGQLDHYSVCLHPDRMAETIAFYEAVLGLVDGERPPFPFPGHWLYNDDGPVVHLIGLADRDKATDCGRLDHIAFLASDIASTCERLRQLGVVFDERYVPLTGMTQIFVSDPNGIVIELLFSERSPSAVGMFGEELVQ